MNKINKFLRLSALEQGLFIQALIILPFTAIALRLVGFKRCQSALARLTPFGETVATGKQECLIQKAHTTARLMKAAVRHGLYQGNCLPQSLALWWLLRRQGIDTELRIGVRKDADRFEAHAWVEYLGVVLNDLADVHQRFVAFEGRMVPAKGNYS